MGGQGGMIIVDRELERREADGRPVRVAMVGAGYIGRGAARQMARMPGIRLVAIANRTQERAERAFREAGAEEVFRVDSVAALEDAISRGGAAITQDPDLLCRAGPVDVVIEATGDVEFGAHVSVAAIEGGKHLVLMNAELDATLGPILKERAARAGVVLTNTDGDQPGVVMNLLRFVRTIGVRPVLAGNIKGLQDPYRTPETQRGFAEAHGQDTKMITSFADGTKLSMEMAVVANATGFRAGRRGMYGPRCDHVDEAPGLFDLEELLGDGPGDGLVDYVLGAQPGPGVFVLGYDPDPARAAYMKYLKMGEGPLYTFYVPYHLPHLEVPISAARAALFQDPVIAPRGAPVCEVLTVAKRDLKAGEVLDGIGGFTAYGVIENADLCREMGALPMGLADGCRLRVDVPKDRPVRFGDVDLPEGRLSDRLWEEQVGRFVGGAANPGPASGAGGGAR
jgi:predicted homoserine dehydrogenase-like protein